MELNGGRGTKWDDDADDDDDDDDDGKKGKGKHHVAWPRGSRQACVAGDGPLNMPQKGHGRTNGGERTTTTTSTTTWLAPCHKELLEETRDEEDTWFFFDIDFDGVEDEVDQTQCPFWGGWGEDVMKTRHHRPELIFHCRESDNCERLCDCLGGHIKMGPPLFVKIVALIASAILTLSTLFLALPKIYRYHQALGRQLSSISSDHLARGNDTVIINGVAMPRHQAMYQFATNHDNAFQHQNTNNHTNNAAAAYHNYMVPYNYNYPGAMLYPPPPMVPPSSHPGTPQGGTMYVAMGSPVPTPTNAMPSTNAQKWITSQGIPSMSSKSSDKIAPEESVVAVVGEPVRNVSVVFPGAVLPTFLGGSRRLRLRRCTTQRCIPPWRPRRTRRSSRSS